ncbi:MAG: hypothetical protein BalsKO_26620 [Balneolaceae bacterium]
MNIGSFIEELKRRNVTKVATAYAIAGWVIIQVSDIVFPRLGLPDWTITFIIALVGIGFPIALIVSWAFELTPDGMQKSSEVEITESVTASTGKKLNGIIIASLGVLVILLLSERIFFAESTIFDADSANIKNASIAVLPFVNMSADESNEYFSDGLSEELLNGLAKIEGMQVAGRTSSFSFKNKNDDLRIIAEQLGVKHILEGSVRKDGNQVRITAQLIQADNGFHLWSETYDRELESIFAIQEEISRKVVGELKVRLLPSEDEELASRPTQDIEAYNIYLEATQVEVSRQAEDLKKAIELYKRAIALDPSFALAHARAAIAYTLLFDYGNIEFELMIEEAQYHTDQAFLINGNLGEAFLARAQVQSNDPRNSDEELIEQLTRRAIELIPNSAFAHNSLYIALQNLGKQEEAYKHLLIAHELDPLSNPITNNTAGYYMNNGDNEKALELVEANIARDPEYSAIYLIKNDILRMAPRADLVDGFKFMYDLNKSKPGDLRFIRSVELHARDLNMVGLSTYQSKQLVRLYPNNFEIYESVFPSNSLAGNWEENFAIIEEFRQRFGTAVLRQLARPVSFGSFFIGEYEAALETIDEAYPEIKILINSDSLLAPLVEKEDNVENLTINYAASLLKLGRTEEAEQWASKVCEYYEIDIFEGEMIDWEIDELSNARMCAALNENGALVAEINRIIYFDKRGRIGWPLGFREAIWYLLVKDHPDVMQVRDEIMADIHQQRAEVIEWLKEEGEWQQEWDVEN